MGWATEIAPNVHVATIQHKKDRGTPIADGSENTGAPVTAEVLVDPMSPNWNSQNGFQIEQQIYMLSADDDAAALRNMQMGDRVTIASIDLEAVVIKRARVAEVSDFPLAEILVEDQRQGGRR